MCEQFLLEKVDTVQRPRHRWENNIEIKSREIASEDVDYIHLAEDKSICRLL
jgi:hypothetical protein